VKTIFLNQMSVVPGVFFGAAATGIAATVAGRSIGRPGLFALSVCAEIAMTRLNPFARVQHFTQLLLGNNLGRISQLVPSIVRTVTPTFTTEYQCCLFIL
jgi:hypothetical protein